MFYSKNEITYYTDKIIDNKLPDIICHSHIRWDTAYQRPRHIMKRFAEQQRVFYIEEPVFNDISKGFLCKKYHYDDKVIVITPYLPLHLNQWEIDKAINLYLNEIIESYRVKEYILWYYTPKALSYTHSLNPILTVYECVEELSKENTLKMSMEESLLLSKADVTFVSGMSLYEAKKDHRKGVYYTPNGIDREHFFQARGSIEEPLDQKIISGVKIGYCGIIDDRIDCDLLSKISQARENYQFIMLGPISNVSELPKAKNIHYLGDKKYTELPGYLSEWDAAMLPFKENEFTKFNNPIKVLEYLAAGKKVVSTYMTDVDNFYKGLDAVKIASTPEDFCTALDKALTEKNNLNFFCKVDFFLRNKSWNDIWRFMDNRIKGKLTAKSANYRNN